MTKALIGYADVIRIYQSQGVKAAQFAAQSCGIDFNTLNLLDLDAEFDNEVESKQEKFDDDNDAQQPGDQQIPDLKSVPFWRVVNYEQVPPTNADDGEVRYTVDEPLKIQPGEQPRSPVLDDPANVAQRLKKCLAIPINSRSPDTDWLTGCLAKAELPKRIPYIQKSLWGRHVQVILDHSDRLAPFWEEQAGVLQHLVRLLPHCRFEVAKVTEGVRAPVLLTGGAETKYQLPPAGSVVIAISDLACLAQNQTPDAAFWIRYGRQLRDNGVLAVALIPAMCDRYSNLVQSYWQLVPWERPNALLNRVESVDAQAKRLLAMCVHASRLHLGLLREFRVLIGANASAESLVWQHSSIKCKLMRACPVNTKMLEAEVSQYQKHFLPDDSLIKRAIGAQKKWRNGYSEELWAAEVLSMPERVQNLVFAPKEIDRAISVIAKLEQLGRASSHDHELTRWVDWFQVRCRSESNHRFSKVITPLIDRYSSQPDQCPPAYRPEYLPPEPTKRIVKLAVCHGGDQLIFQAAPELTETSALPSPIGELKSKNSRIKIQRLEVELKVPAETFWKSGQAPSWASAWGEDEYGKWAEISVENQHADSSENVVQRLRWIPSGIFLMGSPENEQGRWEDEGPQHEVEIGRGFWLFDTPVTQVLYEAVMGENPSEFVSPQRPVEGVSWYDAKRFGKRLNKLVPGLGVSLPYEAQWEYACRAGTESATYVGDLEIKGEKDAPILDDIAWYGGNSGVGFDLKTGVDSSEWSEKQYPHARAGTRAVGQKRPNPWGLYDMLGNVYEWCQDGEREYRPADQVDPTDSTAQNAGRVVRGGAWFNVARYLRAAFRLAHYPVDASNDLGFRCAQVHAGQVGEAAEPIDTPHPRVAEQRGAAGRSGEALLLDCRESSQPHTVDWPQWQRFVIHSDVEILTLEQINRPQWASAMGRDQYGLWASFHVSGEMGVVVVQKMRWIAPGRFWMGSPEHETGRITERELDEHEFLKAEGPRHEVELTQGYWLFDTPVTQALFEAAGMKNKSKFKSPDRPVENVSWEGARAFIKALNERADDLNLALPTEAQWEYACRAGTESATYAGDLEIKGERNAPILDKIAWYGGNSGKEFDLESGEDSSNWPEKQYPHDKTGTRKVALKAPNDWGLYDMLGNVWEWCGDSPRNYTEDLVVDPVGKGNTRRVVRGGAWDDGARDLRAACRVAAYPDFAVNYLGFRCAQVHAPEESGAERPGKQSRPKRGRVAEQRTQHGRSDK